MKFNERELIYFSCGPGEKEGRIYHKTASSGSISKGFKERWFKLKGNLLFYYKVNEYGGVCSKDPVGLFVLEDCQIRVEDDASHLFAFSITFEPEPDKKHYFGCCNQKSCDDWLAALRNSSYQSQRMKLFELQMKLVERTGSDPLAGVSFLSIR